MSHLGAIIFSTTSVSRPRCYTFAVHGEVTCVLLSPRHLGEPCARERRCAQVKHMILHCWWSGLFFLQVIRDTASNLIRYTLGIDKSRCVYSGNWDEFMALAKRSVLVDGDVFFSAPAADVEAERLELMKKRGRYGDGVTWRSLLTPFQRQRLVSYENLRAAKGCDRILADLEQNPCHCPSFHALLPAVAATHFF